MTYSVELALDPSKHRPTGNTRHYYGSPLDPDEQVPVPVPTTLRIVQYDGEAAFYLLYLDAAGNELTDTWHQTLDDAKHQAEFEFNVAPDEWPEP